MFGFKKRRLAKQMLEQEKLAKENQKEKLKSEINNLSIKDLSKKARIKYYDIPKTLWDNKLNILAKKRGVNKIPKDLLDVLTHYGLDKNLNPADVKQGTFIIPISIDFYLKNYVRSYFEEYGSGNLSEDLKGIAKMKIELKGLTLFYHVDHGSEFYGYDKNLNVFYIDINPIYSNTYKQSYNLSLKDYIIREMGYKIEM